MPTKFSMEALPSSTDAGISLAGFVSATPHLELRPQQIYDLLAQRPGSLFEKGRAFKITGRGAERPRQNL
jgi:hypothetical protein